VKPETKHADFCFAGQPAPCEGYFPGNRLPCVCGAEGNVATALAQVAVPAPAGGVPPAEKQGPPRRNRSGTRRHKPPVVRRLLPFEKSAKVKR